MPLVISTPGRASAGLPPYEDSGGVFLELDGKYRIHQPTYAGDFDQILVLDKNWVIVSTNIMSKLYSEIDTLSTGGLQTDVDNWHSSIESGSPNFSHRAAARTKADTYLGEAKNTHEVPLGVAANFDITSSDDSNYSSAQNPTTASRAHVSYGGDTDQGELKTEYSGWRRQTAEVGVFRVEYRIYSYLEMPTSLVSGATYTITKGSDSVTFLFDESYTVSRAIKINQCGYLSDAGTKKAYLGCYLWEDGQLDLSHATTYEVVNAATGAVANSGSITLIETNPQHNPQLETGTTTGTTTSKLVDSGQNFTTTIKVGDRVYNTTDTTEANVTAIDSDTALSIDSDIFISGEGYEIRRVAADVDTTIMYGEDVYEIDFSAMTDTGTFFIRVPGVGRSWPFKHGLDTYSKPYYTTMRGMFRQRMGMGISGAYSDWVRQKARCGPYYYESDNISFPKHDSTAGSTSDSGGHSATNVLSQTATSGTGTGFSVTVDTDNLSGGEVIHLQDETNYDNSPASEGTFSGGTGYNEGEVIIITGGASVRVDAVSSGVVTEFTVTNTDYSNFDVCGGSTDYSATTKEAPGGWHDAADWDCTDKHFACIFDMLNAYAFNSAELSDNQLDIPESGDGVPDILSEARHGLELFRLSQDANGGISCWLETWTHPNIDSEISGNNPPGAEKTDYSFGPRTRWSSLLFAAAAAQYAELVNAFDATDSALYEQAAIDAYTFGNNSSNSLGTFGMDFTENRGAGPDSGAYAATETDAWIDPYWMHAKLRLYITTSNTDYLNNAPSIATLEARIQDPYVWRWNRQDYSPWIHYSIIDANNAGATSLASLASTWTTWFTDDADDLIAELTNAPYESTWPREQKSATDWGGTNACNDNRSLLIAYELTTTAKYRNAAIQNADYAFGCNPMGMSWTTGLGYVYPFDIQHENSERDLYIDPWPGITLYGITTRQIYGEFEDQVQTAQDDNGSISSLTQSAGTATATTATAHGQTGTFNILVEGATQSEYNIRATATVTGASTFTYAVDSGATSPATGTISWRHDLVSDSSQLQGNIPLWRNFKTQPQFNVWQNEFTVHESIASTLFTCAVLMKNFDSTVQEKPRPPEYVYGRWYLI